MLGCSVTFTVLPLGSSRSGPDAFFHADTEVTPKVSAGVVRLRGGMTVGPPGDPNWVLLVERAEDGHGERGESSTMEQVDEAGAIDIRADIVDHNYPLGRCTNTSSANHLEI